MLLNCRLILSLCDKSYPANITDILCIFVSPPPNFMLWKSHISEMICIWIWKLLFWFNKLLKLNYSLNVQMFWPIIVPNFLKTENIFLILEFMVVPTFIVCAALIYIHFKISHHKPSVICIKVYYRKRQNLFFWTRAAEKTFSHLNYQWWKLCSKTVMEILPNKTYKLLYRQ